MNINILINEIFLNFNIKIFIIYKFYFIYKCHNFYIYKLNSDKKILINLNKNNKYKIRTNFYFYIIIK